MKTAVIIPARYASTRYPGKPLVNLRGKDGTTKPLIQRSWDCAVEFTAKQNIFVATDDDRIAECVRSFGGQVIITSSDCLNGTERCAEALEKLPSSVELIINLQGDAPLTPYWFLADLENAMNQRPDVDIATPVLRCDLETYNNFKQDRKVGLVGGTTAVFSADNIGLYFSKEVIPFLSEGANIEPIPVFHHVGVYAYRPKALRQYMSWPEGTLEKLEGLEQIRFLENNANILCVEVDAKGKLFWELNNPIDVERIESVL